MIFEVCPLSVDGNPRPDGFYISKKQLAEIKKDIHKLGALSGCDEYRKTLSQSILWRLTALGDMVPLVLRK